MSFEIGDLVIARFNEEKHFFVKGRIACFHDSFADIIVEKTNVQPTNIKRYPVFITDLHHIIEKEKVSFT